ncbi:hypothetical protein WJ39_08285 [Burkholderia diffusa]|nr:hypothetical protein WJ39_08285 [Burkholderia diffusa]
MAHDVSILDSLVQLSLESARRRVVQFARLAAMARYGVVANLSEIDRATILESIQQLSEQYERDARGQREVLAAAYIRRHVQNNESSMSLQH